MENKELVNWLNNFKEAWEERNTEKVISLFSKDVIYFESPLNKPCENLEAVSSLWKVVPTNQKDVIFNFEIISNTEKISVVNWKLSRIKLPNKEKEIVDGIFLISLNKEGLCTLFKQWRASKITPKV